jgi:predicted dehydrogenase
MCDLSESRLKHLRSLYSDVQGETSFEHLLNGMELDATVIATSVKHHYPLAKASLLAGKHTLIEKPMASSSAECEELIDLAARQGVVLMVGHTFLYSPVVRKIVDIIQAGDIGDIRYINSRRLNLGLSFKGSPAWTSPPRYLQYHPRLEDFPVSVNCQGNAHVTPVADVTNMSLTRHKRFATIKQLA